MKLGPEGGLLLTRLFSSLVMIVHLPSDDQVATIFIYRAASSTRLMQIKGKMVTAGGFLTAIWGINDLANGGATRTKIFHDFNRK
jgi:hypothetical protein